MKHPQSQTYQQKLIFIHIPKAAGTTFRDVLEREYEPEQTFVIRDNEFRESLQDFNNLPRQRQVEIKLLVGHMPFGAHKFLTDPAAYITLMREPVDRIISHYYYVRRNPGHKLYHQVTSCKMDLIDYVCSGISRELDNGQTRLISGMNSVSIGECSEKMLNQAIDNIHTHFVVIGLVERFDETLILMRHKLGWSTYPFYTRRNTASSRKLRQEFPETTVKTIERYNQLDCELYDYVRRNFDEQIETLPFFRKMELQAFHRLNQFYQKSTCIKPMLGSARKKVKKAMPF